MKKFSSSYMLLYSLGVAAVAALLLTTVSVSLKSRQDANVRNEKMQALLASIQVDCTADKASSVYKQFFVEELTVGTDGSVLSSYSVSDDKMMTGKVRAFNIKLKDQQRAEKENGTGAFPVYRYEKDGKQGYVVPAQGVGLWGAVYANVALDADFNAIVGVTFSHDSETPGLGAEITSDSFKSEFIGKQILDENGKVVSVAVVKDADDSNPHQVDAISGGTMTSNGVSAMLQCDLTRYQKFIDNERKGVRQ